MVLLLFILIMYNFATYFNSYASITMTIIALIALSIIALALVVAYVSTTRSATRSRERISALETTVAERDAALSALRGDYVRVQDCGSKNACNLSSRRSNASPPNVKKRKNASPWRANSVSTCLPATSLTATLVDSRNSRSSASPTFSRR